METGLNLLTVALVLLLIITSLRFMSCFAHYDASIFSGNSNDPHTKDGLIWDSRFQSPAAIAYDVVRSRMFVSDLESKLIRKIDFIEGNVSTICGGGAETLATVDCKSAYFSVPAGLAVSSDGKYLFVSDSQVFSIRRISLDDQEFTIKTIAAAWTGDYNETAIVPFKSPRGLAFWNGTLLVVDSDNNCVWGLANSDQDEITATPYAGQCTQQGNFADGPRLQALFKNPTRITHIGDGNFAILEVNQPAIRILDPENVTTISIMREGSTLNEFEGIGSISGSLILTNKDTVLLTERFFHGATKLEGVAIIEETDNIFDLPTGVVASQAGAIFITDSSRHHIVRVDTPPELNPTSSIICATKVNSFTIKGSHFCPKQCDPCNQIRITNSNNATQLIDCVSTCAGDELIECSTGDINIDKETIFNATLAIPTVCPGCPHVGFAPSAQIARIVRPAEVLRQDTQITERPANLNISGTFPTNGKLSDFQIKLANGSSAWYDSSKISCIPNEIQADKIRCRMTYFDHEVKLDLGQLMAKVSFKGCWSSAPIQIAQIIRESGPAGDSTPDNDLLKTAATVGGFTLLGVIFLLILFFIVAVVIVVVLVSLKMIRKSQVQKPEIDDDPENQSTPDGIDVESQELKQMGEVVAARITVDTSRYLINLNDLKITQKIGVGAYGVVYKGLWKHETVAIKKFRDAAMYDSEEEVEKIVREFAQECSILAQLRHPNIVNFFGATLKFPDLAMVLEFADKGALHDLLYRQKTRENLSWDQRLRIMFDVAKGMAYLHGQQLLHRDLKSQNILITSSYNAKVSDFGMSKFRDSQDKHSLTAAVGSLLWMAPEVALGEHYSLPVDVFSFAIIISEMLTDRLPYSDLPPQNQAQVHVKVAADFTEKLRPTIPPIEEIFEKMCSMQSESTLSEADREKIQRGIIVADDVMRSCWRRDPELRLTFEAVVTKFDLLLQEDPTAGEHD